MSRLWPEGEPLAVLASVDGLPGRFTWQGCSHRVAQVQQQWRVDADWWRAEGAVRRMYYAVITTSGLLCVLYQDSESGAWFLAKVYD
jgi:hypothetical protein